ncbi:MAG: cupin domain-containing protein [Chloroflexi bacterium]|nr:cupin domain-containing protein [Chloroflexota bacterium]
MSFPINKHAWGYSQFVFATPFESLAKATGKAGGASSLHYHRHKHNTFAVIRGTIKIQFSGAKANRLEMSQFELLEQGESFTAPAGVKHRMIFLTDATLHELYQATKGHLVQSDDIVRLMSDWAPDHSGESEVLVPNVSTSPATD